MGNANAKAHRLGTRSSPDADIVFLPSGQDTFSARDGIEPSQLVVELTIDKLVKLDGVLFRWIAEDTYAAPPNHLIVEATIPLAMETLTSYASLPRPWPTGRYRVDVLIGGNIVGSIPFRVDSGHSALEMVELHTQRQGSLERVALEDGGFFTPTSGTIDVRFQMNVTCTLREGQQPQKNNSSSYVEWNYRENDATPQVQLLQSKLPAGSYRVFTGTCSLDRAWPEGQYEVRLVLDGYEAAKATVFCQGKKPAAADSVSVRLFCGEPNSKKDFSQSGRADCECGKLYVAFEFASDVECTTEASVTWTAVDCKEAPPNTQIAAAKLPTGKSKFFHSDLSLARPWPVGHYKVELTLDGKVKAKREFDIDPKK